MSRSLPIVGAPIHTPASPTVQALDTLWAKVSDKRLYAPPHFWRYLKLRWRTKLRLLDPQSTPVIAPPGKVNDCAGCTDMCCIGAQSTVLLRLRDIAALIDHQREDLIISEKPDFSEAQLAAKPALKRQVQSRSWTVFPVLAQNSFGACEALTVEGKCSLYPNWPISCARFPYSLHADEEEVFYSPRCDSFWIRPDAVAAAESMAVAAVTAYNERIKDSIMLEYAREEIDGLGIAKYLCLPESGLSRRFRI